MNFEELDDRPTPSADRVSARDSQTEFVDAQHSSPKGPDLSSTPSDPDWVSPFTLPPLPAFRRHRDQSSQLKSPEQLRDRTGSGAYYAAAWGSPYATPSPRRSPGQHRANRHSVDTDSSSPFNLGPSKLLSPSKRTSRRSIDSSDTAAAKSRVRSLDGHLNLGQRSERPNWLSDSDESDQEGVSKQGERTPKSKKHHPGGSSSSGKVAEESSSRHQVNTSVATITPETFTGTGDVNGESFSGNPVSLARSGDSRLGRASMDAAVVMAAKPLPTLPPHGSLNDGAAQDPKSPTSSLRPRPGSMHSFQRPKRRVVWKGKTCIIAMPLVDRESTGLPPLLSPRDIQEKIDRWTSAGFSTNGFELGDSVDETRNHGAGQSRPAFPDPQDVLSERRMRAFTVQIPNQAEWEAWVNYLNEEKLRALGVTPSASEAPLSSPSPFSASNSRTSSRFPGALQSPPAATTSVASDSLRGTSHSFSPPFTGSSGMGSQIGSVTSSQYNGFTGPLNGHKQSFAQPGFQGRMTSPFDYSVTQPISLGPTARSPAQGYATRNFSPTLPGGIQSMGEVLSPPSSIAGTERVPNAYFNPFVNTSGNQHVGNQALQGQQNQKLPAQPSPALSVHTVDVVPHSPSFDQVTRPPLEIAHPTPRSHRHNLSAALQKEIDGAEEALKTRPIHANAHEERGENTGREQSHEPLGEDDQVELPILKRPEIVEGGDDRSEIETNPSISASPLLTDANSPFGQWHALSDNAKDETRPRHKVRPSVSKFNVEAPEFDPRAGFSSSNFTFGKGALSFTAPQQPSVPLSSRANVVRKSSVTRLNVEAPSFTPGVLPKPTANPGSFRFSSATFNVQAPEFNPGSSAISNFATSIGSTSSDQVARSSNIFGPVVIDPRSKVNRRTSKALPILRPRSKDGTGSEESEFEEEEDGRPSAPSDRQKRTRRFGSDGDRSPTFADSAPFKHSRILSEIVNEASTHGSEDEKTKERPVDGWAYIPAEDGDKQELNDSLLSAEMPQEAKDKDSPFIFDSEDEAVKFSESRPVPASDGERTQSSESEPLRSPTVGHVSGIRRMGSVSHKPRSSLSALAKPFEFKLSSPALGSTEAATKSRKSLGLEASRFAPAPSPPPTSPPAAARLSSPHDDLYQYIKSEDEPSLKDIEEADQSDKEMSMSSTNQSVEIHHAHRDIDQSAKHFVDETRSVELSDDVGETMPSFEEIDAVMRQFEDNPELGIERSDTPIQSTPLVDMGLGSNFRSDAPSPSPRRGPPTGAMHRDVASVTPYGLGIGVHRFGGGKGEVSDWNETLSATEEEKLHSRAQFFDGHVNDLVGGLLENRLGPLEKTLLSIQESINAMAARPWSKSDRRSVSTDVKESADDADDEDGYDALERFSSYRGPSPGAKRDRKADRVRIAVAEAFAAQKDALPLQPNVDLLEIRDALAEMRRLTQPHRPEDRQSEMRMAFEDVISHHPRLQSSKVQQGYEASEAKHKQKIDSLESMLRVANERVDDEAQIRREADAEVADLRRRLAHAEERATSYREVSEEAQRGVEAFVEEKEAYKSLARDFESLSLKNNALENTISEYRASSDQWRDDIKEERMKNKEITRTLRDLQEQLEERSQSRQALRHKVEKLQTQVSQVVEDLGYEQAEWRKREHELLSATGVVQNTLEVETRRREKLELELDELVKQHREDLLHRDRFEHSQQEVARLQETIATLREESKSHQDIAFRFEKELEHARDNKDAELATATARLQAELESTQTRLASIHSDSEAQILRLQSRLDTAELDLEEQKATHEALMSETIEAHGQAARDADEKREAALEEQHANHDKKLNDLRERHTRALHNSSDDRHRLEFQLNEKLAMSEDKVKHLESKLADLDERLEITKSAARAAVEAAMSKGINLPTPAPSVVASPPQRSASASMPFVKGTEIPEKISPQALRESIMVLQDQLQNREQKIETLEAELAAIDKEAPTKVKEQETEIGWLRELLSVRIDDIEDIIGILSQEEFDREATKAAAIRLKANLQMEQQLKERAAGLVGSLPSLATLSSYAQSPRGLPLAAAAAWGNWRKARDTSIGAISELATNLSNQTPSKSTIGSPASFLSGIMTPPSTNQRTPTEATGTPPTMRPLAAAVAARKGSSEARPLRAYNAQPRTLSSRQQEKRPDSIPIPTHQQPGPASPHTPISTRTSLDLAEDVDDDASPFDARMQKSPEELAPSS